MALSVKTGYRLTSTIINQASESYKSSTEFITRLIPASISTILFYRLELSPDLFSVYRYADSEYRLIKKRTKNKAMQMFYKWISGIIRAVEKDLVKGVRFLFMNGEADKVLEEYNYKFVYDRQGPQKEHVNPLKIEISNSVVSYFEAIKSLGDMPKMEGNVCVSVELEYRPDVTPSNAELRYFRSSSEILRIDRDKTVCLPLIDMGTGYHFLKCSARVAYGKDILASMDRLLKNKDPANTSKSNKKHNNSRTFERRHFQKKRALRSNSRCLEDVERNSEVLEDGETENSFVVKKEGLQMNDTTISIPYDRAIDNTVTEDTDINLCEDNEDSNEAKSSSNSSHASDQRLTYPISLPNNEVSYAYGNHNAEMDKMSQGKRNDIARSLHTSFAINEEEPGEEKDSMLLPEQCLKKRRISL